MKSVVNNVIAMTAAVACLGLVLSRPVGADDSDEGKEIKKEAHVVVVQADGEQDIAAAVKKALDAKLKDLSPEIRKKLEHHLQMIQAGKEKSEVKIEAVAVTGSDDNKTHSYQVVSPDGKGKQIVLKWVGTAEDVKKAADEKAHTIRIVTEKRAEAEAKLKEAHERMVQAKKLLDAKAKKIAIAHGKADGEKKAFAISVAVDGDDVSAKDGVKQYEVKIEDGKVLLNGKRIAELKGLGAGKGQVHVELKADATPGEKKEIRRKVMFLGQDGKVQEFELDVDAKDAHVEGAHAIVIRRTKDGETEEVEVIRPKVLLQTLRVGDKTAAAQGVAKVHVAAAHAAAGADAAHTDVTKRLQNIEVELRKIRQMLQKMQNDDDDDEGDDEDDDD